MNAKSTCFCTHCKKLFKTNNLLVKHLRVNHNIITNYYCNNGSCTNVYEDYRAYQNHKKYKCCYRPKDIDNKENQEIFNECFQNKTGHAKSEEHDTERLEDESGQKQAGEPVQKQSEEHDTERLEEESDQKQAGESGQEISDEMVAKANKPQKKMVTEKIFYYS
jgi:hypothetical protein